LRTVLKEFAVTLGAVIHKCLNRVAHPRNTTLHAGTFAVVEDGAALVNTHAPGQPDAPDKANDRRILRIGHRGAAGHAPENTLAAIRKGIALGVDFVEFDVQRSRDGRLVLVHDERVDRTTNGVGRVSGLTWEELQLLDAGEGERIPSLEAALAAASGRAGVMLEAKAPGTGPAIYRAVQEAAFSGPVVYASFLHAEILEIRRIDPLARTLALTEWAPAADAAGARAAKAALVGLAHGSATGKLVDALHQASLEVWLYTVNEPTEITRAISIGADGVISDYPERVSKSWPGAGG
jgi:glycerophosphoryl diester phosphodiesterase